LNSNPDKLIIYVFLKATHDEGDSFRAKTVQKILTFKYEIFNSVAYVVKLAILHSNFTKIPENQGPYSWGSGYKGLLKTLHPGSSLTGKLKKRLLSKVFLRKKALVLSACGI